MNKQKNQPSSPCQGALEARGYNLGNQIKAKIENMAR